MLRWSRHATPYSELIWHGAGASTGAIVGGVIGAVIGIVLVTLLVTFFLYRVHKKRRLRKEAMGKPKSSTTSAAGLFDSARHSETSNLSQKR